jgi:hypothetical protein
MAPSPGPDRRDLSEIAYRDSRKSPAARRARAFVFKEFVAKFVEGAKAVKVGNGMDAGSNMGSLANPRRVTAIEGMVKDAVSKGAKLETGGHRVGNKGYFFEPTVLSDVPKTARAMNEEPFAEACGRRHGTASALPLLLISGLPTRRLGSRPTRDQAAWRLHLYTGAK